MKPFVHAQYNDKEERKRRNWFSDPNDYPDIDPKRLEDALSIDWDDVTAEDSEFIVTDVPELDLANILSIRYLNEDELKQAQDQGYYDGYVVEYMDRSVRAFACYYRDIDLYEIELEDD